MAEIWRLVLTRAKEGVYSEGCVIMLARPTSKATASTSPHAGTVNATVRQASESDADMYARDIGTDSPVTFRARLSENNRCFVMVQDGRFAHATWVATTQVWMRELRRYFRPPLGDAYVYESYTRPEARGRGAYPLVLREIASWAEGQGLARLWVGVEADNPASRRAVEKAGFARAFESCYRRRFGRLFLSAPVGPHAAIGREALNKVK